VLYIPGHGKPYEEGLKIIGGDYKAAYGLGKDLEKAFDTGKKREASEESDVDAVDDETEIQSLKEQAQDEIPF